MGIASLGVVCRSKVSAQEFKVTSQNAGSSYPQSNGKVCQKKKSSDIWEKWGRHIWEKGVLAFCLFFFFFLAIEFRGCGKNGV